MTARNVPMESWFPSTAPMSAGKNSTCANLPSYSRSASRAPRRNTAARRGRGGGARARVHQQRRRPELGVAAPHREQPQRRLVGLVGGHVRVLGSHPLEPRFHPPHHPQRQPHPPAHTARKTPRANHAPFPFPETIRHATRRRASADTRNDQVRCCYLWLGATRSPRM